MPYLKEQAKRVLEKERQHHFRKARIAVSGSNVSIFCNCCIAGCMYHDLGLEFLSPTINLFFGSGDYYQLVSHLKEYLACPLSELHGFSEPNPVGKIDGSRFGLKDLEVHFAHYTSFAEAKECWERRSKRVNYQKIFLLIECIHEDDLALLEKYVALPYKKAILTKEISQPEKGIYSLKYYTKNSWHKPVTRYISAFGRKGYDEFNFVDLIFRADFGNPNPEL
jgi:uncharacterized protein (DUF1919 family)